MPTVSAHFTFIWCEWEIQLGKGGAGIYMYNIPLIFDLIISCKNYDFPAQYPNLTYLTTSCHINFPKVSCIPVSC